MVKIFNDSLPNETGVCGSGHVITDSLGRKGLRITAFAVARQDSATPIRINYTAKDTVKINGKNYTKAIGCEGINFIIGYGHDHPTIHTNWSCTGSDNDALFLAGDTEFLFLITLCLDGRFEVLWQDGRRQAGWWRY